MNRRAPCLSILLLTEDSGSDAFDTFQRLVKELLKQVDEYVQTQPDKITFEPTRNKEALQALHANVWKSTQPRDRNKQVELVRTLATQLLLENGWAFFHFDGDRVWKDRDSSENAAKESVCLGAKHNLVLASQSFPAREARGAGKSFAAVVQALNHDAELCEALRRTYSYE